VDVSIDRTAAQLGISMEDIGRTLQIAGEVETNRFSRKDAATR
jgi:hypothetical protein